MQRPPFTKPASSATQPACDHTRKSAVQPVVAGRSMKRSFGANEMFFAPNPAPLPTLHHFPSPSDRLPQISDIFGDGALLRLLCLLSPQCLLNLSAGSRALHCHATCDDVYRVVICGSLLTDSVGVLTTKPDGSRRADA